SEYADALNILSNWRSAHAYPLHAISVFLKRKSSQVDSSAVVVQRLKRASSILSKLKRFPKMKLQRMQDLGGCRVVLKSVVRVEKLAESLENGNTTHQLHKTTNYIDIPKPSGYRGIHLIYKYKGNKNQYQDYLVEIQLRSKVQHAWATAVEIVDSFTSQALKSSHGSKDWLDFFMYASAAFAKIESRPIGDQFKDIDVQKELIRLERKLNAIHQLNAFIVTSRFVNEKNFRKTDYFLLELDESTQMVELTHYRDEQLSLATQDYLNREKKVSDNTGCNVVLVSAISLNSLKTAYPNYFADSTQFIMYLKQAININESTTSELS
ncbi:MAG: RelA/SpoT domain-containing protein, partial [Chamaesiphon sp.]|nr:RelA/SpoT domain-containing protein [Chamaesiphon sp.]